MAISYGPELSAGGGGASPIADGTESTQLEAAATFAGIDLSAGGWGHMFVDFARCPPDGPPGGIAQGKFGTSSERATTAPGTKGISRLETNVTASGIMEQYTEPFLGHIGTSRWCLISRFAIPTAVDANARIVSGLKTTAPTLVYFGANGAHNTTHFCLSVDATNVNNGTFSNIALLDTSMHTLKLACRADNKVYVSWDGGAETSVTQTAATDDFWWFTSIRNGATAANRAMDRRWFLLLHQAT